MRDAASSLDDLAEVVRQAAAKRALEVATAGAHNPLLNVAEPLSIGVRMGASLSRIRCQFVRRADNLL